MKNQSIACFTKALVVLAGFAVCSTALAQPTVRNCVDPTVGSSPALIFTIKVSGPNLEQITNVGFTFSRSGSPLSPGQDGFEQSFGGQPVRTKAPGVFEVPLNITEFTASGSYTMTSINIGNGRIGQPFSPPAFTPPDPVIVCNPKSFGPFKVDSIVKNP